jgi:hypothetical protein
MKKLESSSWPYLAGIFDGEGTVYIGSSKNKNGTVILNLQTKISNTDLRLMQWMVSHFGGHYSVHDRSENNPKHKVQYAWYPTGKSNRTKFFEGILPYLVIKKEQVLVGLEFDRFYERNGCQPGFKLLADSPLYKENLEKRLELRNQLVKLNHRGKDIV